MKRFLFLVTGLSTFIRKLDEESINVARATSEAEVLEFIRNIAGDSKLVKSFLDNRVVVEARLICETTNTNLKHKDQVAYIHCEAPTNLDSNSPGFCHESTRDTFVLTELIFERVIEMEDPNVSIAASKAIENLCSEYSNILANVENLHRALDHSELWVETRICSSSC